MKKLRNIFWDSTNQSLVPYSSSVTLESYLKSPTDSERYPHGANCTWIISGEAGSIVRLNWNSFALEEGGYECPYDHVSVYDNSTR